MKSLLVCAKIRFLLGEYPSSLQLLQETLSVNNKSFEAYYWQGLIFLFTYEKELGSASKAKKLKLAEESLISNVKYN